MHRRRVPFIFGMIFYPAADSNGIDYGVSNPNGTPPIDTDGVFKPPPVTEEHDMGRHVFLGVGYDAAKRHMLIQNSLTWPLTFAIVGLSGWIVVQRMDPVSIAASCIAFIGACHKLASGLQILRDVSHASEEVSALIQELNDLQNVLTAVGLITKKRSDNFIGTLLSPLFDRVDRIIHELCGLCGVSPQKVKGDDDHGDQTIKLRFQAGFRWTLAKKRVQELRERLKTVRLDLSNSLTATSLLDISSLLTDLHQISAQLLDRNSVQVPSGLEASPLYKTAPMPITAEPTSRLFDVEAQEHQTYVTEKASTSELQLVSNRDSRPGQCKRACSCVCHIVYRVKTPAILQNLVGSLLVKSNGLYGMSQACNENSCRRSSAASLRISYRFPEWFLNRMISSFITSNHVDGPQLSLVALRIVSDSSAIFSLASTGNTDTLAQLLQSGLASPRDVSATWGYTPLHCALDHGRTDLCRFLLDAGARADITDIEENSVIDLAWNKIYSKKVTGKKAEELECMFKKDDWFEERQFTVLHKIILDLLPSRRDLQEELSASTCNIDVADSEGRTPLSWAAELGNLWAVQTLLGHGADLSSKSIMGWTPLHYAAKAPTSACLIALLEHGALVDAKNKWGHSSLNVTTYFQNDESFINALLDHGADFNGSNRYGPTALNGAVVTNQYNTARCLLARGASAGSHDLNVINDSINSNSHECISLLLKYGAISSTADMFGETPLHAVARCGDLRTIKIFQATELDGVNVEAKTHEGLTAWDLVRQRIDLTDEIEDAFVELMQIIQPENPRMTYSDAFEKDSPVGEELLDRVAVKTCEILVK
ncbi:MAG: hypothetical protein Q9170_004907 [Blastenia crenularia]